MNSPPTSGLCNTPWIMRWHYFLIEACPNISAGRLEAKTGCTTALLKPCSLLTHQTQSCKTKTNIYLYKHVLLYVDLFLKYLLCAFHTKGHAEGRSSQQQPPLQAASALNLLPAVTLGSNTAALPARLPA